MKITYKKAGVDVEKADVFVKGIKKYLSASSLSRILAYGSLFNLKNIIEKYREPVLVSSADGVGTKLKIAQSLNVHNTVGIDLVAMNVNDIVCLGAQPLFFLDYIACGKVEPNVLKEIVKGINNGLRQSGCVLLGGETAQMPGMYKKGEYDLAGFCVGIVDRKKIVDGRYIKPGDKIIGIESSGLHSNGFSLVRKVFSQKEIKRYSKTLLKPTRIYVKPTLSLLRKLPLKGIGHNTGGAFYSKITKILPRGLAFRIHKQAWRVPKIFGIIQDKAKLPDKEMYATFNMGIGMIAVADARYVGTIIKFFNKRNLNSYCIGQVARKRNSKIELI